MYTLCNNLKIILRMDTIIIHTDSKKTSALVAFLKAFNIPFKLIKDEKGEDHPYHPDFVEKILEGDNSARDGNTIVYTDTLRKDLFQE